MYFFFSVSTESQKGVTKGTKGFPHPLVPPQPPKFGNIGKAESKDAEMFWEVTESPADFVNGNHPDNGVIMTHDHVDQIVGQISPTKRVKKILPPFEEHGKGIRVENFKGKFNQSKEVNLTTENVIKPSKVSDPVKVDVKKVEVEGKTNRLNDVPKNVFNLNNKKENSSIEDLKFQTTKLLLTKADEMTSLGENIFSTTQVPNEVNDEIQGIRLVPNDYETPEEESKEEKQGVEEEEGGEEEEEEERGGEDGEELTMQKTIWDLLKEREDLHADANRLDENVPNLNKSDSETSKLTSENSNLSNRASKSLYDHFDSDSAEVEFEMENFKRGFSNVEKHELPLSYASSWLQINDKKLKTKGEKEEEKTDDDGSSDKEEIPQDVVSNLLDLTQNGGAERGVTVSVINGGQLNYEKYGKRSSKWFLLLLTGNSTIVQLRKRDFTKYLKLNLAARLSVEYDDVTVNKVILAPPKILVNVTVFASSGEASADAKVDCKARFSDKGEASLYKLAETNATLLELSGEEYHVIRFMSLQSEKPEAEAHRGATSVSISSRQGDAEFIMYTFIGSTCACILILTFFLTINKYFRKVSDFDWPWLRVKSLAWKIEDESEPDDKDEFNGISPAVIYSGGFPRIRGSWMNGAGVRQSDRTLASIYPQSTSIELGSSPPYRKRQSIFSEPDNASSSSRRQNKLQIYNCDADSLVIPMPVQSKSRRKEKLDKNQGSDTHPLDVRICGEKTGQVNPIFLN